MNEPTNNTIRLFLDSSVVLAAIFSKSGGSFRLFRESNQKNLKLFINQYVLEEIVDVVKRKKPAKLEELSQLLNWADINTRPKPNIKLVKQVLRIIHPKDAPVLAGAIQAKTAFLITLDRKDFFTQKLQDAKLPFIIAKPQNFFQDYYF